MADGELLKGQRPDNQTGIVEKYTEQTQERIHADAIVDAGTANVEVTPKDAAASLVRTFVPPTQEELDAAAITLHDTITFQLPDTLLGVTAYYTAANADGSASETGDGSSVGTTGSMSISLSSSSQGSASIAGDVYINIRQNDATDVPARVFLFYVPDTATRANVLTKLGTLAGATVNDWPRFQPRTSTLFLLGQQVDVSARANLSQSASVSGSDASYTKSEGTAVSKSVGVSLRVVTIPPTIHDEIIIDNSTTVTQAVEAAATVEVTRTTAGWLTSTYWPARTITTTPDPVTATAAATTLSEDFTDTIPATPGLTEIPVAGLYARIKMEPWKYGFSQVRAEVVDFSYFA